MFKKIYMYTFFLRGEGDNIYCIKSELLLIMFLHQQKSFKTSLESPEIMIADYAKFDRPGQLHIAYQALHRYVAENGRLPKPRNKVQSYLHLF